MTWKVPRFLFRTVAFPNSANQPEKKNFPELPLSRMREIGKSAKGKVNPWLFLFPLTIFLLSFPLADSSCDISYIILQDEFGQETTVARMGGRLLITCKTSGSSVCKKVPSTPKDGKFEIAINPGIINERIQCCCNGTSGGSWDGVMIKHLLCSPSQASGCSNTELCHQKSDTATECKQAADVCVDARPPNPVSYQLRGRSPEENSIVNIEYCKALKMPEENDQVELEVKGPEVELLTFSK